MTSNLLFSGRDPVARVILGVGAFRWIIANALEGWALAIHWWSRLAGPGGLFCLGLAIAILSKPILGGMAQAVACAGVTFLFSGGNERGTIPTGLWIGVAVVAAVFLWAAYSRWKNR